MWYRIEYRRKEASELPSFYPRRWQWMGMTYVLRADANKALHKTEKISPDFEFRIVEINP